MNRNFAIAGAGLVGSLLALMLARKGHHVDVYERRSDMRKGSLIGGRSINLALSDRGWKALDMAGMANHIRKEAIPMKGRMIHDTSGNTTFQPYGIRDQAIYSVSRGWLNQQLIEAADRHQNVTFHFDHRCEEVLFDQPEVVFHDTARNQQVSVKPDYVIGADGAFSMVRLSMQKQPRFNYAQFYLEHGYKELSIPPHLDGTHQLDKHALHIWPRRQFMMIALPNPDGSFTCTLFLAYEGEESFSNLNSDDAVTAFFKKHFADALPLMPTLLEDFNTNPTSDLVTVRCNPWVMGNRTLLIGDAAHAIVPFYGQGMNAGFEDCRILMETAEAIENNWDEAFWQFGHNRVKDGNAISELALRNFIEMRDQIADPKFLLRKKIANHYHEKYPHQFIPMYSMVTFTHQPYSIALEEAMAQDELFEELLSIPDIENRYTGKEVETKLLQWASKRPVYNLAET